MALCISGDVYKRQGYYLAGKPADWEVNEDWNMLLDGRELKGESITFLGEFATAPANPKNGESYRNTTDRATYIYQDGRWQLMISDGKDGKGYEYIYTVSYTHLDVYKRQGKIYTGNFIPL